jgi:ABC-type glycerol-3-phosphate transport system substrate-binding protein
MAAIPPLLTPSGDEWTIAEIVFMNLAPNFIGGREGRLEYLSGERCFNDENAVAAFQAVADIAPYLPAGQEALTYYDSQQLFLMGEAAMWFGGSWDIPFFESENPDLRLERLRCSASRGNRGSRYLPPGCWDGLKCSFPAYGRGALVPGMDDHTGVRRNCSVTSCRASSPYATIRPSSQTSMLTHSWP